MFRNNRLTAVGCGCGRCSVILPVVVFLPVVFSLSLKETEEREQERGEERTRKGGESEREGRLAVRKENMLLYSVGLTCKFISQLRPRPVKNGLGGHGRYFGRISILVISRFSRSWPFPNTKRNTFILGNKTCVRAF